MWKLSVWAIMWGCVWVRAATWHRLPAPPAPLLSVGCDPPQQCLCKGDVTDQITCSIGGQSVEFIVNSENVYMHCNDWAAFDSPVMPAFSSELRVPSVTLENCPPPGAGRSYAEALGALNVTLLQTETQGNLSLVYQLPEPPLAKHHFTGLERLVELKISYYPTAEPSAGFLDKLHSLRSLELRTVHLLPDELDNPPASLRHLTLECTGLERLPQAILELPDLEVLKLSLYDVPLNFTVPSKKLHTLYLKSSETAMRMEEISALESLSLSNWEETQPAALTRCDALRELVLDFVNVEALPERWVADCPRLEILKINNLNLTSLPLKLLEGASALVDLTITNSKLESLEVGLFDDVPNLRKLGLMSRNLHTLGVFAKLWALQELDLSYNQLDRFALYELAGLHNLTKLNLENNPRLGDVCDNFGYSKLIKLNKLKELTLSGTSITRICRDWRENMPLLERLDLSSTQISVLQFEDFQYTRDYTVKGNVILIFSPIYSVRFTEGDYMKAQTALESRTTVYLNSDCTCDCNMYWTWLVLVQRNTNINVKDIYCGNFEGRLLRDLSADEVCPGTVAL